MYQRFSRASAGMSRGDFIKLGGVGLAGAVLLGTAGRTFAQSGSSLASEFESAAREYEVPEELLLAMAYVNTLWEMPPPTASPYEEGDLHGRGSYGIMQLVQNPSRNTLGKGAELTGLAEEQLKNDRAANVRGGAAVLADIAGTPRPDNLNGWQEAVAKYGGIELYAEDVYRTLQVGARETISTGETLELAPQDVDVPQLFTAMAASDYGKARWVPAASGNYTNASRERSHNIDMIVVHVVEGSASAAVNWFANPDSPVSAHYVVNKNGSVTQCVRNADIGYHAGHWATNTRSIGIEHGGYVSNPNSFTAAMYKGSARLAAWCSRKHRIPIDRQHIIGHNQVPGCRNGSGGGSSCHTDPGRYFNWDKYLKLIKSYR
jgi:hypothetical protein